MKFAECILSLSALLTPTIAFAQQDDGSIKIALALAAYQQSKDHCFYEDAVSTALHELDMYFVKTAGEDQWSVIKERVEPQVKTLGNMGRMMGAASDCKTYGLSIGDALMLSLVLVDFDQAAGVAAGRLADGGGVTIAEKATIPPPKPYQQPKSMADMMKEYNAANPDANKPSDTGRGSAVTDLPLHHD